MNKIRARLPQLDGVSLNIPNGDIPVRDPGGVVIGYVVGFEVVNGETYVDMELQGFFYDESSVGIEGFMTGLRFDK